jgi:hypothetical protein
VVLAYADGVLLKLSMRMSARVLASSDPHLVKLDSVEYLGILSVWKSHHFFSWHEGNGRIGAFGDGGFTLYDANFALRPVAAHTPQRSSFLGWGGSLCGTSLCATAADGTVALFDDILYP